MHIFLANFEKRIKGKHDRLGYNTGQIALSDHWKILGLVYRRLIFCIVLVFSVLDALTQQMGTAVTQFTFAQAVQKWLRYAPDRAGGTGRQTSQTSDQTL